MPEIKHLFTSGRMNKDLDERAIPSNEYRDALNVQVSTSDGSDVGALQNISGNQQISLLADQNAKTIGSLRDTENNKIYWFIATTNKSIIAEYDEATNLAHPVLVDVYSILNFSENYLITGCNIIDGLLFWTDNQMNHILNAIIYSSRTEQGFPLMCSFIGFLSQIPMMCMIIHGLTLL